MEEAVEWMVSRSLQAPSLWALQAPRDLCLEGVGGSA